MHRLLLSPQSLSEERLLGELLARASARFRISDFCFDKQIAFIKDPAPFKTAVCSRRAGKTVACAANLITAALSKPRIVCLYITLSRSNAKKLIWPELKFINSEYKLGGVVNESDLSVTFVNGSVIYASGAGDASEIEKFRGLALYLVYIDECQSFRPYIENLVDEVISKALFDYAGTLCLTGTPGPIPSGYFYDRAHSKTWSNHSWTMHSNPWLQKKSGLTVEALIQRDLNQKGVDITHPTIQRECFGRWVMDTEALVFRYDAARNDFTDADVSNRRGRSYVIGVDLGFDDSDAIAVLGWAPDSPNLFLEQEIVVAKQGITELAQSLEKVIADLKAPVNRIVMDTGGLGKKIAEEIRKRFQIPVVAAEKSRKFEYIELMNDALRTGRLRAKRDSKFAQDCLLVEWDRDNQSPDRPLKTKDSYHSDICDAVLYSFRESLHWLHEPIETKPTVGSDKWALEQEANLLREQEERLLRQLSPQNEWEDWPS